MSGRVLFVHHSPGARGGSELAMLADAAEARAAGWEPLLLHGQAGTPGATWEPFAGVSARPSAFSPAARERRAAIQATIAELGAVDLVHAHLWHDWGVLRDLAAAGPVVATCHLPVCPNGARYHYDKERRCDRTPGAVCLTRGYFRDGCGHTSDLARFGWPALARNVIRTRRELETLAGCALVIAPSEWQRQRLVLDGLPPGVVTVRAPTSGPPGAPAPLEPPAPRLPVVLLLARLVRFKGAHHLIRAGHAMRQEHEIWIAGDGPERAGLEALAQRLGEPVRFLGSLERGERESAFAAARVVAVPSLWPETYGLTGPEAAQRGLPTVAYQQGGVHDWLRPEAGDIGVEPGDIPAFAAALDTVLARGSSPGPRPAPSGARLGALYDAAVSRSDARETPR